MNTILDVLKLRRVRLDYISPAICPVLASGSGSSVFMETAEVPETPTAFFAGICEKFVAWNRFYRLSCMSLYRAVDFDDPNGPATLIEECLPAGFIQVASPGWWSVAPIDLEGQVGPRGESVLLSFGASPVQLPTPDTKRVWGYAIFKNPDPGDPTREPEQVLTLPVGAGAFEVTGVSGCYRLQAITLDGASDLGTPICRVQSEDCCPDGTCSEAHVWDSELCSCYPDPFSGIAGPSEEACLGIPYSSYLEALDAEGPCLWELLSGAVPTGLTLGLGELFGNTTSLSGIPSATGNYSFTVRCTDFFGTVKEAGFSVSIFGINESSLPNAVTDTAYSQQLTAGGGIPPYVFSVVDGAFPIGISMTSAGLISGTPSYPGNYSVEIEVTDSNGRECSTVYPFSVLVCPEIVVLRGPTATPVAGTPPGYPWDADNLLHSDLDHQRRVLWYPNDNIYVGSPPYQRINCFDTATSQFLSPATDSGGQITTAGMGDLGNGEGRCVVDTKNDRIVFIGNQSWWAQYDLETRDLLSVIQHPAPTPKMYERQPAYDPARGYIYFHWYLDADADKLKVFVYDCASNGILGSYAHGLGVYSNSSDQFAFVPSEDTLFISNVNSDGGLYHKWNPDTHAFALNVGPLGYTSIGRIRYIREANLLVVEAISGGVNKWVFVDPATESVVGEFQTTTGLRWAEGNSCDPSVFWIVGDGSQFIYRFSTADLTTKTNIGNSRAYQSVHFDEAGKRLFAMPASPWEQVEEYNL